MELFKGQSLLEFTERFKTDLDCEEQLASLKWEDGYCCRKCGHKKYQVRKDFSRTCNGEYHLNQIPEKLIAQYEETIASLKEQIVMLKEMLNK